MKIEMQSGDKIMVELTDSDMKSLDITYEDMDYGNIETRRVIWTLLDEAKRVLGRNIDPSERMLIEAMPGENGGCTLLFTVLPFDAGTRKKLVMKKSTEPVLMLAENRDALLSAVKLLDNFSAKCGGYEILGQGGESYVLLRPAACDGQFFTTLLCEFGDIIDADEQEIARLREYGKRRSV